MKALSASLLALLLLAGCGDSTDDTASKSLANGARPTETTEKAYADVTEASIDQFLNESDVAVLEFWATWCGPCKIMGPRFESVAQQMQEQASFAKVDIDDNPKIASQYGIRSIPTVLVLKDSQVVETMVGVQSEDKLRNVVAQYAN